MNQDELKQRVTAAIESTWQQFQAEHPALSQVIDQAMLSEHVVGSLADDQAFQIAYEQAIAAKVGAHAFSEMMIQFVGTVVNRLR